MTEFKYSVGDKVRGRDYGKSTITYRYKALLGNPRYILRFPEGGEFSMCESEISPIPSTPLDANGVEIGVGDIVRFRHNCVDIYGRVVGGDSDRVCIKQFSRADCIHHQRPQILTRLEKATPSQITLGSRVRVKDGGREFRVRSGYDALRSGSKWSEDPIPSNGTFYSESELELIE